MFITAGLGEVVFIIEVYYIFFQRRNMYKATFLLGHLPRLCGGLTTDPGFKGTLWDKHIKCHRFSVKDLSFRPLSDPNVKCFMLFDLIYQNQVSCDWHFVTCHLFISMMYVPVLYH